MITEKQIEEITARVVANIKENYFLVERKSALLEQDSVNFLEYILEFVSDKLHINKELMRDSSRYSDVIEARRIFVYISRKYAPSISFAVVGKFICRHHSTIIHFNNCVIDIMRVDKVYRKKITDLENEFKEVRAAEIAEINKLKR